MLLNKGRHGDTRLSLPRVGRADDDRSSDSGAEAGAANCSSKQSPGLGLRGAVYTRRDDLFAVPGRYGWDGGYGTSGYIDPRNDLVGILLTQRMMNSPQPPARARSAISGPRSIRPLTIEGCGIGSRISPQLPPRIIPSCHVGAAKPGSSCPQSRWFGDRPKPAGTGRFEPKRSETMRFMVIVKADNSSEAGVMPSDGIADRDGQVQRDRW